MKEIRVLFLEDDPLDLELALAVMEEHGYSCTWDRVETREEFLRSLNDLDYDLILADYNLPTFDGLTALSIFKERDLPIPFILVSGTIGEELSIESLQSGATDYVMKNRLSRLGPAVDRALREIKEQKQRKMVENLLLENERRLNTLMGNLPGMAYRCYDQPDWPMEFVSQGAEKLTGYKPEEMKVGGMISYGEIIHNEDRQYVWDTVRKAVDQQQAFEMEYRIITKTGQVKWVWEQGISVPADESKAGVLEGFIADITDRKNAQEDVQAYLERIESLLEIDRAITSPLDLQEVLDVIMLELKKIIPYDSVSLQMIHKSSLQVIACRGFDQPEKVEGLVFPLESGLPNDRVIKHKETFVLEDVKKVFPNFLGDAQYEQPGQIQCWLGVPLMSRGNIIGMIALDRKDDVPFTRSEIEIANAFAIQAALAIDNARLLQDAKDRAEELEALNRISRALRLAETLDEALAIVLEETLDVVNAEAGEINLSNPQTGILEPLAATGWFENINRIPLHPDEGIGGKVFQSGEAYITDEFITDPRTSEVYLDLIPEGWGGACMPIRTGKQISGVFYVSKPSSDPLTESQVKLLDAVAEMAGVALHRLRLHQETTQRLQQLQALHSVNQSITGSFDISITLDILLNQVRDQLKVDAAGVLLYDTYLQELAYAAGVGFNTLGYENTIIRLGKGYAGLAVLEQRMIHVGDLLEKDDIQVQKEMIEKEGFRAYWGVPLAAKGNILGLLEVFRRQPGDEDSIWKDFLKTLASQAAIAIADTQLFTELQRANLDLRLAYEATIEGWARAMEMHDKETEGHSRRVEEMTMLLAQHLNVSPEDIPHLRRGTLLHDIGKMAIPDEILFKKGELTEDEWKVMREHPSHAYEMLRGIDYLLPALEIPFCHHEKWDGSGYPRGLKGDEIPMAARIFAVVDVYDALTSKRPYRPAHTKEEALAYIKNQSGKHFDPRVVETFIKMIAG